MVWMQAKGEPQVRSQLENEGCTNIGVVTVPGQGQTMVGQGEDGAWRAVRLRDGWEFRERARINDAVERLTGERPAEAAPRGAGRSRFRQDAEQAEGWGSGWGDEGQAQQQAAPQPAPVPVQEEQGLHARALTFQFDVNTGAVENAMQIIGSDFSRVSTDQMWAYTTMENLLIKYGYRAGGHIEIRIDLEAIRRHLEGQGQTLDDADIERRLRSNPSELFTTLATIGVEPSPVQIWQTASNEGLRPAGTDITLSEFAGFVSALGRIRSAAVTVAEAQATGQPTRVASLSNMRGYAEA